MVIHWILLFCLFLSVTGYAEEEPSRLGATFSQKQCEYLDLDWRETYLAVLESGFDILRLVAYWDEIEPREGKYDFTNLDWQIQHAKEKGVPLLLSVGMKAPRWPEFFIPPWLLDRLDLGFGEDVAQRKYLRMKTLRFIHTVVDRYKKEEIIHYWQVENEPLDRSGAKFWWINSHFVKEEAVLIKETDLLKRPIVINIAAFPNSFLRRLRNLFTENNPIQEGLAVADILGINVYPVVGHRFWRFNFYFWTHPKERSRYFTQIQNLARRQGKEVWITELQSEPWEPGRLVYKFEKWPPTGWPEMMAANFKELRELGFKNILLWGVEYWHFRKIAYEDESWWKSHSELARIAKENGVGD